MVIERIYRKIAYLDTVNRTMDTPMYEKITHTQISLLRGFRKLNTPGFCFIGFLIMMLIPKDMKGLLKSITRSRSDVIVMGAIAMSASCKNITK